MESVKSAIAASITERHGACRVEIDVSDLCIKVCVHRHPEHVIYVRPNDANTRFECHYARREDVQMPRCGFCIARAEQPDRKGRDCLCMSAEMHAWAQQRRFEMVRIVPGVFGQFASIAIAYVDSAVERMTKLESVDSRKLRVYTFEEARLMEEMHPRPRSPPKGMPAPPSRRTDRLIQNKRSVPPSQDRPRTEGKNSATPSQDRPMKEGKKKSATPSRDRPTKKKSAPLK